MPRGGARPGAGRKARAGEPAKKRSFRATDSEWAAWQDAAADRGYDTIDDYIRAAADAFMPRQP
jgi:hypothetical protein